MKKVIRAAAVAATFAGFALPGFAAAQTATVSTTGPNSHAHVNVSNKVKNSSEVKNNLKFKASNSQTSTTGNAKVGNVTTAKDVGTGNASADNATAASVAVDNSGANSDCGCDPSSAPSANVSTTGPNSPANVKVTNDVSNKTEVSNYVDVSTNNKQTVKSGNASAYNSTTVGNVTTGDASATNSTSFDLVVTN